LFLRKSCYCFEGREGEGQEKGLEPGSAFLIVIVTLFSASRSPNSDCSANCYLRVVCCALITIKC